MAGNHWGTRIKMQKIADELDVPLEAVYKPHIKKFYEGDAQIIMVQGLEYRTPQVPSRDKIRGYNLPKEDQIWFRDETYLQWNWNTDEKTGPVWYEDPGDGQEQWYEREIEKLHVGDWVMINGKATYFNNFCYFFHQWFVLLEGIYPYYKDTSLEYFRFFELCRNDRFTLGDIGIKGRRVGLSSMSACIKLLIAILLKENTIQGIVSKTGTDAQEMFFMVKNGLENLPEFLIPDLNKVTDSEIHIAKPAKRISKHNTKPNADKGKNNRVNWLDTAENAYDGRGLEHITVDEGAKFEKVNVQILVSKITDTLVKGGVIKGHMSVFSTVNKGDKGGDNFRKIYQGSDHLGKLNKYGQTETKLKRFFIPGFCGYWGYVDKYGSSVIETPTPEQTEFLKTVIDPETGDLACPDPYIGAREFLQEDRNMKMHDPELWSEQVRKYPFTWQEVFRDTENNCAFNLQELTDQIERIETLLEGTGLTENGRPGYFKRRDEGKPYFEDSPGGMWHILEFIDEEDVGKYIYMGNIKCPDNTIFGVAGLDPFAHAKQTVDKGSDACLMIHKRYDALNPEQSNYPCAMFIGRPTTKQAFFDQIYLGIEYYGIKMLGERSPTDWVDEAQSSRRYMASPDTASKLYGYLVPTKRANNSEVFGANPQDREGIEQHLTCMVEYALNNMRKIKFLRLLKDMLHFNIKERTVFDACMAWGYALMALKADIGKPRVNPKVMRIMELKKNRHRYSRR